MYWQVYDKARDLWESEMVDYPNTSCFDVREYFLSQGASDGDELWVSTWFDQEH